MSIATRRASKRLALSRLLPLSHLSRAGRTWRAAAQPQKGRSASGALVTAVSKSVHERARASRRDAWPASVFRRSTLRWSRQGVQSGRRRKSRAALSKPIANVSGERRREGGRKRERASRERALVAPGHRPRCRGRASPRRLRGPRTRSAGTAIFPNRGHAPANENAACVAGGGGAAIHQGLRFIALDIAIFLLVYPRSWLGRSRTYFGARDIRTAMFMSVIMSKVREEFGIRQIILVDIIHTYNSNSKYN